MSATTTGISNVDSVVVKDSFLAIGGTQVNHHYNVRATADAGELRWMPYYAPIQFI
jgi:hypothetical protein